MKEIKFKTSRGEFLVVDGNDYRYPHYMFTKFGLRYVVVSEITEEQAKYIVFRIGHHSNGHLIPSALELLHSLLKSKGIHLFENPYEGYNDILLSDEDNKKINDFKKGLLEQKTFYNPYIFKLND